MSRTWIKILFLAVLTTLPRFGRADVIGGDEVGAGDSIRRSTVALYQQMGSTGALCTASLVTEDIAVTAAHCVEGGVEGMVVLFGRDLHGKKVRAEKVTAGVVAPGWTGGEGPGMDRGDIALVRFDGTLPEGYAPARLLPSSENLRAGEAVIVAGFGIDDASTHEGAGVLRKTKLRILEPRPGTSEMVLDQTEGSGACHGDSGGPAFVRRGRTQFLAGVTSRGYPDSAPDDCAHGVVYTKVSAYQNWIQQEINRLERGD